MNFACGKRPVLQTESAPIRAPADPVGPVEVRQHQDVEQLGAGSGAEGVQALPKPALKLVPSHGREATPSDCPSIRLSAAGQRPLPHVRRLSVTGVMFAHKPLAARTQLGHAQTAEPMRAMMMAPFASVRPVREPRSRSTLNEMTARTIERVPRQKAITHKVFCQPDGPSQSTLPDSGVNVVAAAGMLIRVAISAVTAARKVQSRGGTSAAGGIETSGRGGSSACEFESPFVRSANAYSSHQQPYMYGPASRRGDPRPPGRRRGARRPRVSRRSP
jgi:hypothetical protein